jgi:hypothetical protein
VRVERPGTFYHLADTDRKSESRLALLGGHRYIAEMYVCDARHLRLETELRIRRRNGQSVGGYRSSDLFNRRLYDVGQGFQLLEGRRKGTSTLYMKGICMKYLVKGFWAADAAD